MLGKRKRTHNFFQSTKRERHLARAVDGLACGVPEDGLKGHKNATGLKRRDGPLGPRSVDDECMGRP